jgi:hypothetical protein
MAVRSPDGLVEDAAAVMPDVACNKSHELRRRVCGAVLDNALVGPAPPRRELAQDLLLPRADPAGPNVEEPGLMRYLARMFRVRYSVGLRRLQVGQREDDRLTQRRQPRCQVQPDAQGVPPEDCALEELVVGCLNAERGEQTEECAEEVGILERAINCIGGHPGASSWH